MFTINSKDGVFTVNTGDVRVYRSEFGTRVGIIQLDQTVTPVFSTRNYRVAIEWVMASGYTEYVGSRSSRTSYSHEIYYRKPVGN